MKKETKPPMFSISHVQNQKFPVTQAETVHRRGRFLAYGNLPLQSCCSYILVFMYTEA